MKKLKNKGFEGRELVIKTAKDTVNKEQVGSIYETRPFFRNDPTFMLASGIYRGITKNY